VLNIAERLKEQGREKLEGKARVVIAALIGVSDGGLEKYLIKYPEEVDNYGIKNPTDIIYVLAEAGRERTQGKYVTQIADELELSEKGLYHHLENFPEDYDHYGILQLDQVNISEKLKQTKRSLLEGKNETHAAEILGVDQSSLSKYLERHPEVVIEYGIVIGARYDRVVQNNSKISKSENTIEEKTEEDLRMESQVVEQDIDFETLLKEVHKRNLKDERIIEILKKFYPQGTLDRNGAGNFAVKLTMEAKRMDTLGENEKARKLRFFAGQFNQYAGGQSQNYSSFADDILEVNDDKEQTPGGIDLNPALLDLQIKRDSNGIPLPLPLQPIESMNIQGFTPIIIHVTPVNVPLLLGFEIIDSPIDTTKDSDSPFEERFTFKAIEPTREEFQISSN